ncbi:hypothetical protein XA68_12368 [Ophiocordyceps unilateralis]|uniref:Uncharacterized protein n=1 Tax=Ophiocordyceps unilateralis TaxID=268505 RepID=A0A2A9PP82_OPHUN|nr:hypothetical protein XA68_12368 [Ophiocordyceps unilateralis]
MYPTVLVTNVKQGTKTRHVQRHVLWRPTLQPLNQAEWNDDEYSPNDWLVIRHHPYRGRLVQPLLRSPLRKGNSKRFNMFKQRDNNQLT